MRRRPDSTARRSHVERAVHRSHPAGPLPAGALVTSVDPRILGPLSPTAELKLKGSLRGLTAAAQILKTNIDGLVKGRVRIPAESWQAEVWELLEEAPELRFVGDRQAAAVSQCRMFIGRKSSPDAQPTPVVDGPIAELSQAMFGDAATTAQALRRAGQHIVYNGESELVVSDDGTTRSWAAWAPQEVTGSADTSWKINDGMDSWDLTDHDLLVRCWTPSPNRQALAYSQARAIRPIARELIGLTKYVGAQIDSRLAGAGLLLVPQGIVPMRGQGFDDETTFSKALLTAMTVPVKDRDSAASLVPLIAEVDPALVDKVQHIKFDSALDPKAHELRDEAIRRVGLGMDSDPSVLLGQGSSNHWSGWLISEDEVRLVVAPIVATICHALTVGWLKPYLRAAALADADEYVVWFDTTPLELRPDRSKDSQALGERGLLSNASVRRENGFSDADAPTAVEEQRNLLVKLLIGAPALAPTLLPLLGIDVPQPVLDDAQKIANANAGTDPDAQAPSVPPPPPGPDASTDTTFGTPDTLDEGPQQ